MIELKHIRGTFRPFVEARDIGVNEGPLHDALVGEIAEFMDEALKYDENTTISFPFLGNDPAFPCDDPLMLCLEFGGMDTDGYTNSVRYHLKIDAEMEELTQEEGDIKERFLTFAKALRQWAEDIEDIMNEE